ncbi:lymphocyte antigen 6E-like [Engystomops pustulosus]|uniref:lymphocyte antigen 6E-like n=1 Tax=Engystomops pustulosus TaxID=76066 RepID=UPI003AFB8042
MNIITAALIAISVLWGILEVNSLQCYSCTDMKNNTECNQLPPVTCSSSSNSTYCFTHVEKTYMNDVKITKRCAQGNECGKGDFSMWVASKHTSCCSKDLCNEIGSGKTNLTYNSFLIIAAFLALCTSKNI